MIPLALYCLFQSKWGKISFLWLVYLQSYAVCLTFHLIYTHWVISRMILLSGDVETNPGPDRIRRGKVIYFVGFRGTKFLLR